MSESAVAPHFEKILIGLGNAGLTQEDITRYFDAHLKTDKRHGQKLVGAVRDQVPLLTQKEIDLLLQGAYLYVSAATTQYDQMLAYLLSLESSSKQSVKTMTIPNQGNMGSLPLRWDDLTWEVLSPEATPDHSEHSECSGPSFLDP